MKIDFLMFSRRWMVEQAEIYAEPLSESARKKLVGDLAQVIYGEIKKSQLLAISKTSPNTASESHDLRNKSHSPGKDDVA